MSFLFGGGKEEAPEYKPTVEEEKKKIRSGSQKNTILTGPLGLMDEAPVARKTLLGM